MSDKPFEYDRKRAMKHEDFENCIVCGRGMMHSGMPIFYRVTIETMGIDSHAVMRAHGLELQFGGGPLAARIANAMGPNEDLGLPIGDAHKTLLCHDCATGQGTARRSADVMYVFGLAAERAAKANPEKADG